MRDKNKHSKSEKAVGMELLNDLYKVADHLRKAKNAVDEDFEKYISEKAKIAVDENFEKYISEGEENIIRQEILPALSRQIADALQHLRCELVLEVSYIPGQPLNIKFSRKPNSVAAVSDEKEMELDPEITHSSHLPLSEKKICRNSRCKLSVIFADGSVIEEKTVADTLYVFVQRVGVEKVRKVVEKCRLKFCRVPVISNRRDEKYGSSQKDLGNGWLLITHSCTAGKKRFIERVSEELHLGVRVELK